MNLCNYEIMQSVIHNFTPSPCSPALPAGRFPLKREGGDSSPLIRLSYIHIYICANTNE
jgi:hypothetical protein